MLIIRVLILKKHKNIKKIGKGISEIMILLSNCINIKNILNAKIYEKSF